MNVHSEIRGQLNARGRALNRRLRALEDYRPLPRYDCKGPTAWSADGKLLELLEESRRELGYIRASLRRISDRTFDLCIHCGAEISVRILRHHPFAAACEACAGGFRGDYLSRIRGQHGDIEKLVATTREGIASLCRSIEAGSVSESDTEVLRVLLDLLECELAEHFALEERSGYLEAALEVAPRLSKRAARLRDEHQTFSARMAGLVSDARGCGLEMHRWRAFEEAFRVLREDLSGHEHAESEIIQEAFLDDVGSGD